MIFQLFLTVETAECMHGRGGEGKGGRRGEGMGSEGGMQRGVEVEGWSRSFDL